MANPNLYYSVLRKPLVTEKTTRLQEFQNKYAFRVANGASKNEIRKAVETLFEVEVAKVNVMTVTGKYRRILGRPGRTSDWRKAIVTLKEGSSIDLV